MVRRKMGERGPSETSRVDQRPVSSGIGWSRGQCMRALRVSRTAQMIATSLHCWQVRRVGTNQRTDRTTGTHALGFSCLTGSR
jgi:hypothetical protein